MSATNVKPNASNDEVALGILEDIGIAPDKQEIHGSLTIYQAAETGNLERVQTLIKIKGEEFASVPDEKGYYAMHWAALGGHVEVMRYLHTLNIPLTLPTKDEVLYQPIHWAASRGNVHVIEYLLEQGVNIESPDGTGVTPLIVSAQFYQPLTMSWLIHKGGNPHACDKMGDSALHWASYKGDFDCFIVLLRLGLDATTLDSYKQNALHLAVLGHNLTLIDKCLELGCGINTKDQAGNTPMNLAEGRKYYDVIRWFQEYLPSHQQPFLLRSGIKPGPTKNAHVAFMLFFCNIVFLGYPIYFLHVLPATPEYTMLHFCLMLVQTVMWISYFLARTVNPGYVPTHDPEYEEIMSQLTKFGLKFQGPFGPNNRIASPFTELCHTCETVRPPRSKHCRVCRRCVLIFDHHCPYIYTCVGYRNRLYFATFIVAAFLTCYIAQYLAYQRWDVITNYFYVFCYANLCALTLAITLLIVQTFKAVITNVTVNESVNWNKYDHMKNPKGGQINPFHRSYIRNVAEFCHLTKPVELSYSKRSVLNLKSRHEV